MKGRQVSTETLLLNAGSKKPAEMRHAAVRRLLVGAALLLAATCMGRIGFSKFFALKAWEDACQASALVFVLRFGESRRTATTSTEVLLSTSLGATVGGLSALLRSWTTILVIVSIAMILIHHPCPSKCRSATDVAIPTVQAAPSLGFWQLLLAAVWFVSRSAAGSGLGGCLSSALCHTALLVAAAELDTLLSVPGDHDDVDYASDAAQLTPGSQSRGASRFGVTSPLPPRCMLTRSTSIEAGIGRRRRGSWVSTFLEDGERTAHQAAGGSAALAPMTSCPMPLSASYPSLLRSASAAAAGANGYGGPGGPGLPALVAVSASPIRGGVVSPYTLLGAATGMAGDAGSPHDLRCGGSSPDVQSGHKYQQPSRRREDAHITSSSMEASARDAAAAPATAAGAASLFPLPGSHEGRLRSSAGWGGNADRNAAPKRSLEQFRLGGEPCEVNGERADPWVCHDVKTTARYTPQLEHQRVTGSSMHDCIMLASTLPGADDAAGYGSVSDDDDDDDEDEEEEYDSEAYRHEDDSDGCFSLVIDPNGAPAGDCLAYVGVDGSSWRLVAAAPATANEDGDGGLTATVGPVAGGDVTSSAGGAATGAVRVASQLTRGTARGVAASAGQAPRAAAVQWTLYDGTVPPPPPDVYGCDVADLEDLEDLMSLEEAVAAAVEVEGAAAVGLAVPGPDGPEGPNPLCRGGGAAASSPGRVLAPCPVRPRLGVAVGRKQLGSSSLAAADSCLVWPGSATADTPQHAQQQLLLASQQQHLAVGGDSLRGPAGAWPASGPSTAAAAAAAAVQAPWELYGGNLGGGVPLQEDTLARHTAAAYAYDQQQHQLMLQAADSGGVAGASMPEAGGDGGALRMAPSCTSLELLDSFLRDAAMLANGCYGGYDEYGAEGGGGGDAARPPDDVDPDPSTCAPHHAMAAVAAARRAEANRQRPGRSREALHLAMPPQAQQPAPGGPQSPQQQARSHGRRPHTRKLSAGQLLARAVYGPPLLQPPPRERHHHHHQDQAPLHHGAEPQWPGGLDRFQAGLGAENGCDHCRDEAALQGQGPTRGSSASDPRLSYLAMPGRLQPPPHSHPPLRHSLDSARHHVAASDAAAEAPGGLEDAALVAGWVTGEGARISTTACMVSQPDLLWDETFGLEGSSSGSPRRQRRQQTAELVEGLGAGGEALVAEQQPLGAYNAANNAPLPASPMSLSAAAGEVWVRPAPTTPTGTLVQPFTAVGQAPYRSLSNQHLQPYDPLLRRVPDAFAASRTSGSARSALPTGTASAAANTAANAPADPTPPPPAPRPQEATAPVLQTPLGSLLSTRAAAELLHSVSLPPLPLPQSPSAAAAASKRNPHRRSLGLHGVSMPLSSTSSSSIPASAAAATAVVPSSPSGQAAAAPDGDAGHQADAIEGRSGEVMEMGEEEEVEAGAAELPAVPSASTSMVTRLTLPSDVWGPHCSGAGGNMTPNTHRSWAGNSNSEEECEQPQAASAVAATAVATTAAAATAGAAVAATGGAGTAGAATAGAAGAGTAGAGTAGEATAGEATAGEAGAAVGLEADAGAGAATGCQKTSS